MQITHVLCHTSAIICSLLSPLLSEPGWATTWIKTVDGRAMNESFLSGRPTDDGGYVAVGYSQGKGDRDSQGWITKLDSAGTVQWHRLIDKSDSLNDICLRPQGGYVLVGQSSSYGGRSSDGLVLLLDADGWIVKALTYASPGYDWFESVDITPDGGFVAAGSTKVAGPNGYDGILARFNSRGEVMWAKTYGTPGEDEFRCVRVRPNGDYLLAGITYTYEGGMDMWVVRCKSSGSVTYQHAFGGTRWDWADSVAPTADGGCIVSGTNGSTGPGDYNATIVKLNAGGAAVWEEVVTGTVETYVVEIHQCKGGSYLAAGQLRDNRDIGLAFQLDSKGKIVWQKAIQGSSFTSCQTLKDGRCDFVGWMASSSGQGDDGLLVRLSATGDIGGGGCSVLKKGKAAVRPVSLEKHAVKATIADSHVSWVPRRLQAISSNPLIADVCPTSAPDDDERNR